MLQGKGKNLKRPSLLPLAIGFSACLIGTAIFVLESWIKDNPLPQQMHDQKLTFAEATQWKDSGERVCIMCVCGGWGWGGEIHSVPADSILQIAHCSHFQSGLFPFKTERICKGKLVVGGRIKHPSHLLILPVNVCCSHISYSST